MSNTNTGGPAFPFVMPSDTGHIVANGMTLRDYFAAKAMSRMLDFWEENPDWDFDHIADCSYNMADAMLKAREQK